MGTAFILAAQEILTMRKRKRSHRFMFWDANGIEHRTSVPVKGNAPRTIAELSSHLEDMGGWIKTSAKPYTDTLDSNGRDTKARETLEAYAPDIGACLRGEDVADDADDADVGAAAGTGID